MNAPRLDTARLLRRMLETQTRVVLIGGMAAVAHGVPYLTQDVDFCYDITPENRPRLIAALAPLHPRLRVEGLPDDAARLLPWRWDERTLNDAPNLTLQTDAGPVDLLSQVPGLGGYPDVLREALILPLEGLNIPILDLPGLMKSKQSTGRSKDTAILPLLESTLLLREQHREQLAGDSPDLTPQDGINP